ncbi:MAG: hypothetical protein Q9174_005123, partial [Haloplaca sp. 1 TL-2023]
MQPDDTQSSRHEDDCNGEVFAEPDATLGNQEEPRNPVTDFNKRMAEIQQRADLSRSRPSARSGSDEQIDEEPKIAVAGTPVEKHVQGVVPNAFERMRPRRLSPQVATITIGEKTSTALLGTSSSQRRPRSSLSPSKDASSNTSGVGRPVQRFSSSMQAFAAPETRLAQSQLQSQPSHMPVPKGRHGLSTYTQASGQTVASDFSTQDTYTTDGSGSDTGAQGDAGVDGVSADNENSSHEGSDD